MARLRSDLSAVETGRGLLVTLPGDVLFDFDKTAIRRDARATLAKVAELIGRSGNAVVRIEGHTDSIGSLDYNQRLSERRAQAVKAYLVDRHAIAPGRLIARGYGETRPAATNPHPDRSDNVKGLQRNRRVEIIIGSK